jgi:Glycosyltransferase family 87
MEATIRPSPTESLKTAGFWNTSACVVWTAALLVVIVRTLLLSHRGTSFGTYNLAGLHWIHGENVYSQWMGFVYSPTVAAFFAAFAYLPLTLGSIFWQLLNAAALLGGLTAVLKVDLFPGIDQRNFGISYLLIVPLALGNIDISQANPLVAGLLLWAIAAARVERWNSAALCIAIATFFKIYPIAVGLLICLIAPRRFGWRLLTALLVLAIVPFLFQHWSYVSDQYRAWISTRTSDDRQNWPIEKLPLDLWFLVHWFGHLPVTPTIYRLIQLGAAGTLAVLCVRQTLKGWAMYRVLVGLLCLASIWMTLCGPATESYTYVLLAAPTVLALVQSFNAGQPAWLRAWISAAFALQLLAVMRASFLPHFKPFWALSIQPLAALLFLAYCLFWLPNDSFWTPGQAK